MDNKILIEEKYKLYEVLKKIDKRLQELSIVKEGHKIEYRNLSKEMWENLGGDVAHDPGKLIDGMQYMGLMKRKVNSYSFYSEYISKLETLKKSAYFGRIDFLESESDDIEQIYIGKSRFIDDSTKDIIIYDWRAPICSLFYSSDIGECSYKVKENIFDGELLLKRQYKIIENNMIYCFENGSKIDDTILQGILSTNTSDKIKTIVESIQKEQNKAIRVDKNKTLLVWGPAGCGKTSVALHRAAWLLYNYRDSMKSKNIMIISPNRIFNDYLSDIIPELGEENIMYNTFLDLCLNNLPEKYKLQSIYEYSEELLVSKNKTDYSQKSEYTSFLKSREMINVLENSISKLSSANLLFDDISYENEIIIYGKEMKELFQASQDILSLKNRINRVHNFALKKLEDYIYSQKEKFKKEYPDEKVHNNLLLKSKCNEIETEIKLKVDKIFMIDSVKLYEYFINNIKQFTENKKIIDVFNGLKKDFNSSLSKGIIEYIHLSPILFIHLNFHDIEFKTKIKHLIIDEVQDYTMLQINIFKKIFTGASFTMLGDINQSIFSHSSMDKSASIKELFNNKQIDENLFNVSYRSTKQITEFCNNIIDNKKSITSVNREGDIPNLIKSEEVNIVLEINNLIKANIDKYNSIAVITRTNVTCEKTYNELRKYNDIKRIKYDDEEFNSKLSILPSYMAKGLEYDYVILLLTKEDCYTGEDERKLFYTVCSRALHKLDIVYTNENHEFFD